MALLLVVGVPRKQFFDRDREHRDKPDHQHFRLQELNRLDQRQSECGDARLMLQNLSLVRLGCLFALHHLLAFLHGPNLRQMSNGHD